MLCIISINRIYKVLTLMKFPRQVKIRQRHKKIKEQNYTKNMYFRKIYFVITTIITYLKLDPT